MPKRKPIKICFFSKYPPIEGGVSSKAYWMSRALGKRGVEVHVVTNALTVDEAYRQTTSFEKTEESKEYEPQNVFVHNLAYSQPPFHIPFSPAYLERLINLGLKVVKKHQCDIIDSSYLQPYGMAAALTKALIPKPLILRHAGSDISRLFPNEEFNGLYKRAFRLADIIVTKQQTKSFLMAQGVFPDQFWFKPFQGADPEYFNPKIEPADLAKFGVPEHLLKGPILTYLGKYDRHKSLRELVEAASQIKEDFLLLFIIGGRNLPEFKEFIEKFPSLKNKHYFLKFLPTWYIPSILRASTCLFHLESNFPIKIHMSTQPVEAFACGTPVLMSQEVFIKYQSVNFDLKKNKNVLVVNPHDPLDLKNTLLQIIENPSKLTEIGMEGYREVFNGNHFEKAVEDQLLLYRKLLKGRFRQKLSRSVKRAFNKKVETENSFSQKRFGPGQRKPKRKLRLRHPCLR